MESRVVFDRDRWQVTTGGLSDVVEGTEADAKLVGRLQGFLLQAEFRARRAEQERDAARELIEQCRREVAEMARLSRASEQKRQESEAARVSLLRDHTALEAAARKVADAYQAWCDSDGLFDCDEYDAMCNAMDDLEELLPSAEPEQPEPERVPQRFRYIRRGEIVHGVCLPKRNGAWQMETDHTTASCIMPSVAVRTLVAAEKGGALAWLDHDYEWSQS